MLGARGIRLIATLVVAGVAVAPTARVDAAASGVGQPAFNAPAQIDDWRRCESGDADAAIAGCSAILLAGQGASVELAVAALNRAIAYDAKGEVDRAIADYSLAIRLQPDFGKALDRRGQDYTRQAKYDSAIADFGAALTLAPNDHTAFNARGVAYSDKREYRRAIADFTAAIRLNPNDMQALVNRGHTYVDLGDDDDAVADYSAAIRLDPNNAAAFNYRGVAYNRSGDHDRAIADYSAAIRLRPDYAVAFADRGNAYRDKHDYALAIADYDEAIRLDPSYADAVAGRGFVYMQTGQVDRARDDLEAALRLNPNLAEAHFGLSVIAFAGHHDYPSAIHEIDAMLKLAPGNMNILYARGLYELFDGKYQASVTDFAMANWYTLNGGMVPRAVSLIGVLAAIGFAVTMRPRSHWPTAVRALIRHIGDVLRLAASRSGRFVVNGAIPFAVSVGVAVGTAPVDGVWDSLWSRSGVPPLLVPASGSAIVVGLCLQAFAVRAHQIAGDSAGTGFWVAFGRFNAYAIALFAIGYSGLAAAAFILQFYSQALLQLHLLGIPVFWLAFSLIALVGVLALGSVARCSLMLPAAALGHPLSPWRAWQMQRGSTSQLSLVVSLCAVFGAGLNGLLGQALVLVPPSALPPWPRNLAAIVAAQLSLYIAVALVAVTLSLFYRERMAARRIEAAAPGAETSAGPLVDEI